MAKSINQVQADILTSAMSMGDYRGERIPYSLPIPVPKTWGAPLVGLIKRGYLRERKPNMYDVTPEGEAALQAWHVADDEALLADGNGHYSETQCQEMGLRT